MNILLIRFSALGDVAMLAAVVREMAQERPDDDLTVLSMPRCAPLFDEIAPNVHFLGCDVKNDYKGIPGLYRLFTELDTKGASIANPNAATSKDGKGPRFDFICDMHDVLRTKVLRIFFQAHGYKVSKINKHREYRKRITAQGEKKELIQVPTSFENYEACMPKQAQLQPQPQPLTQAQPQPQAQPLPQPLSRPTGTLSPKGGKGLYGNGSFESGKGLYGNGSFEGGKGLYGNGSFEKGNGLYMNGSFEGEKGLCGNGSFESGKGLYGNGFFEGEKDIKRIGIAPFAAHEGKIYPLDKMERVLQLLGEILSEPSTNNSFPLLGERMSEGQERGLKGGSIILFGGGGKEREQMQQWADKYPWVYLASEVIANEKNVTSTPPLGGGQGGASASASGGTSASALRDELKLMAQLDVMVSMDSANMHLASFVGTRVVSIWGATHPYAGFLGYGQRMEDCVQLDLPCRPCSIYGNKPCIYGDHRCMNIQPEEIVRRIIDTTLQ